MEERKIDSYVFRKIILSQCKKLFCFIVGVRFYRGSNRDTRRRERNLRAKLKKREPEEPM